VKQIIPYRRQNGHSSQHDVGQLWHVYSIVFQHSTPYMIITTGISIWHTCYYFYTRITISLLVRLEKCTFKFKVIIVRALADCFALTRCSSPANMSGTVITDASFHRKHQLMSVKPTQPTDDSCRGPNTLGPQLLQSVSRVHPIRLLDTYS